jgi:hypothetical protein
MDKEDFLDEFLAEYVRFRTQLNTALGEYTRTSDESIVTLFEIYLKTCGDCMVIHEPSGLDDLMSWFEDLLGGTAMSSSWKPMFDEEDDPNED